MKRIIFMLGLAFSLNCAVAIATEFHDISMSISSGDNYDITSFYNCDVTMDGGTIEGAWLKESTTFDLYGGIINDYIMSEDDSVLNMFGGQAKDVDGVDSGIVNINGGTILRHVIGFDSSVVTIHDLHFVGINDENIEARHSSIVTIYDVDMDDGQIRCVDSGTVHLFGGNMRELIAWGDGATIHIYGYDFEYTSPVPHNGTIRGLWPDSTPFDIEIKDAYGELPTWNHVVLHEVPEPATLLLLGLGGLALLRKRRA